MAVRMRLMRMGKKKHPVYRVVVVDGRAPRDGRYIEQIGRYEPLHDPSIVDIDNERAADWLSKGASLERDGREAPQHLGCDAHDEGANRGHPCRGQQEERGRHHLRGGVSLAKGDIVERVVSYIIKSIVDEPDEVSVTVVEEGPDEVVAEVRTAKGDMGRVIGRRGRVAKAVRAAASAAGGRRGDHSWGRVPRLKDPA